MPGVFRPRVIKQAIFRRGINLTGSDLRKWGEQRLFQDFVDFNEQIPINGIKFSLFEGRTFLIASQQQLKALSSAVLGGGLRRVRFIINHTVDRNYYGKLTPAKYLSHMARKMNLGSDTVGLMTAVDVKHTVMSFGTRDDVAVAALSTVGVGNACSAGTQNVFFKGPDRPGTINIVVLIDGDLTDAAMVNAVITATEAKSMAMMHADIHLPDGTAATGTTTDAIVIACTAKGKLHQYSGLATDLGFLVGRTVYKAVAEGISNWSAYERSYGRIKLN